MTSDFFYYFSLADSLCDRIATMPVSKTKVVSKNKASQGAPAVKPVWPPFEHLPYEDAERTITHRWPGQIVTIDNFWSPSLCKKYVSFLSGLPLVTTPGKPKKDEAVRINDRFQVDDATFAERLWSETGLREIVEQLASGDNDAALTTNEPRRRDFWEGAAIGLNPNIRVYRYTKGQLFNKHCKSSMVCQYIAGKCESERRGTAASTCPKVRRTFRRRLATSAPSCLSLRSPLRLALTAPFGISHSS